MGDRRWHCGVYPSVGSTQSSFLTSHPPTIRSEGMKTGPPTPLTSANLSHFKVAVLMSWVVAVVGKEVRDERS